MYRNTWMEVNLDAVADNVRKLKEICGKKIIAVLKADAYGCGDSHVARAVLEAGADMLAVSSLDEALMLRNEGYEGELLILGATDPEDVPVMIENSISVPAYCPEWADAVVQKNPAGLKVHMKVDTGMNRIGFKTPEDLQKAFNELKEAGCLIEGIFTHFSDIMGYGEELKISKTYRNSQEVIDIAGSFIQKNSSQIQKSLVSPKHIQRPIIIEAYSEEADKVLTEGKGGKFYLRAQAVERCIGQILESNKNEGKPQNSSILLIGRYNFDGFHLAKTGLFFLNDKTGEVKSKAYPKAKITFLTAHRAKGLGYDNVIIINAANAVYGFPSKIEDDPVMKLVIKEDRTIEYAEERRLFYVAMTRTKNRVYIVVPQQRPSRFVAELIQDYSAVHVNGDLDISKTDSPDISMIKRCPICGYPLRVRQKKDFGLRLWLCTNEPEICDFMTNDLSGGILPILKCDCCKDGYLIVRKKDYQPFLGCTNYKDDKSGCNRRINLTYYENMLKRGEIEL